MTQPIKIDLVRIDGGTQPRVAISEQTVSEYAEAMASADANMPAVDLFFDGVVYWLADGFHRYHAARKNGLDYLVATVHQGTRRDAVLFSVGANQSHGLRRTNDDKRRAVLTLLNDEEWVTWSNVEIGKRCGVGEHLVRSLRPRRSDDEPRTYTTKHGTEATMNVEKIGKAKTGTNGADRSRAAVQGRRERIRTMADEGYSTRQIAAAVGISDDTVSNICRELSIDVPADKTVGRTIRHDSNRIVEHMVMDADNLTADVSLIDFGSLDRARIADWVAGLRTSRKKLDSFIQRLVKEQNNHAAA